MSAEPTRVLVVEDDDDLRRLITIAVADAGYSAVGVADGAAALAACAERDADVILLDLALPRLAGQAFVDAYRRDHGRAKLIVVTGATSGGEISARMQAAAFLSKPFELDELVRAIGRVLHPTAD